jgi:GTPase
MNPNKPQDLPIIAIVGSPNAGKSSLFNRLIKKRKAIVEPVPGVTRNRLSATLSIENKDVTLLDTGGIKTHLQERIDKLVYKQVALTLEEADIILFVTDARVGVTPLDHHITSLLRKSSKRIYLVVNKVDNKKIEESVYDFYELGIQRLYPVCAASGYGIDSLLKDINKFLLTYQKKPKDKQPGGKQRTTVAIAGRPNVGKSSFINALFKKDVVIVDETPGTTRDSVDIHFEYQDKAFILVDTAGMRHKKKLKHTVEIFSIARSKESVRRAQVVLVVLDAAEGLRTDDIKIIEYVTKYGKPCVVLVNKWDLAQGITQQDYETALKERLNLLEWIPIIFTSCVTGKNLLEALKLACLLKDAANKKIKTSQLNALLERLKKTKRHPMVENKNVNIYYATQTETAPVTFTLFSNHPKLIKQDYLNFIEKNIRSNFGLFGVPIRFKLKER